MNWHVMSCYIGIHWQWLLHRLVVELAAEKGVMVGEINDYSISCFASCLLTMREYVTLGYSDSKHAQIAVVRLMRLSLPRVSCRASPSICSLHHLSNLRRRQGVVTWRLTCAPLLDPNRRTSHHNCQLSMRFRDGDGDAGKDSTFVLLQQCCPLPHHRPHRVF